MTDTEYVVMTFDGVSLRYQRNGGPRCFLADLANFGEAQASAVDTRGRMAHTLQMADNINFGETPYTSHELETGCGRRLSRYVVENSYYARKFAKLDGFFRLRNPADLAAGPVANLCEEFVGLHNYLFSQLLPNCPRESNERILECVFVYLDCANQIMDKFWEDPNNMERAFTCRDTETNGFEVLVDTNTTVGSSVREAILVRQIASIPPGGRAMFLYRREEE
jgi:hypothetical protein